MTDDVSQWIEQLSQGDEMAVQRIWARYYEPLVRLARQKLGHVNRRMADEEDVMLSAFESFCQAARAGRFPKLDDRHDLWKLLVTITGRKAVAHIRRVLAQKAGGGKVAGESALAPTDSLAGIEQVPGREGLPDVDVEMRELFDHLLDSLPDQSHRQVVLYKLEGYTHDEIAEELGCATKSVQRKVKLIRDAWQQEIAE